MEVKENNILSKKLSSKTFILTQLILVILGLGFIFFIYYKINIEYQPIRSRSLGNGPITTAPSSLTLDLSSPDEDLLTYQSSLIVSGATQPNIPVLISTGTQNAVVQSKIDGSFSTVINLTEGENKIKIAVFSSTGDQRVILKSVYYSKERI